jgi:hypothetical protein
MDAPAPLTCLFCLHFNIEKEKKYWEAYSHNTHLQFHYQRRVSVVSNGNLVIPSWELNFCPRFIDLIPFIPT